MASNAITVEPSFDQPATDHALHLPEIVTYILSHLVRRRDLDDLSTEISPDRRLLGMALVCKTWQEPALKLLWALNPPYKALCALPGTRQQYYASKIRVLDIEEYWVNAIRTGRLRPDVKFLALRDIRLCYSSQRAFQGPRTPWMHRFISSSLRILDVEQLESFAESGEDVWALVKERCPLVKKLSASNDYDSGEDSFCAMLDSLRHLEEVHIGESSRGNFLMQTKALSHLAKLPKLDGLTLCPLIDEGTLDKVDYKLENKFRVAKAADFTITLRSIYHVVGLLTNPDLGMLTLCLEDPSWLVIRGMLDETLLNSLCRFASLHHLWILLGTDQRGAPLQLTVGCMDKLLSHLPDLQELRITARPTKNSGETITNAGRRCRKLRNLEIWGDFDLRPLSGDELLFPQRETLKVATIEPVPPAYVYDPETMYEDIRLHLDDLLRAAPKLAILFPHNQPRPVRDCVQKYVRSRHRGEYEKQFPGIELNSDL